MADEIINGLIERQVEAALKQDAAYALGVKNERERCERIIGGLMYESYDISGPECLSRALIAIRGVD